MAKITKPKKIWDNHKNIGEVKRSESTKIVFDLVTRDGVRYINMRDWYKRQRDNEWKPGLAGFAIPIVFPIGGEPTEVAKQMADLMLTCIEQAKDFPLHDPLNEVWVYPKEE